ncbi:hypothetical protein KTO58_01160 [Chitinophaga pendula]|uniref:helix-turn-helix domain-containing protein n=1 Tax=Chitinophaga TaxID=79328 RepID=UPI000BAFEC34|nr:hypothetical protein CK934_28070 [Chitinophaga sp. MD30]UCJ07814.1 hypothetical protein KTO58_01160 [Chitinophaga pendula]
MQQLTFDLTSPSPINAAKFTRQNRLIYQHLACGLTINVFQAISRYQIYHLHSRLSDIRNKHGVLVYDRMIRVKDSSGNMVSCKEYSLKEF